MISYLPMVNAWSLAYDTLNGTLDEEYPIVKDDAYYERLQKEIEENGGYEWTPGSPWPPQLSDDLEDCNGLDYETDYYRTADIDDMYMHHFTNANSSYNDGWTQEYHRELLEKELQEPMAHYFKYHEEEILNDIREYVLSLIHI